jgi:hypothetical protein
MIANSQCQCVCVCLERMINGENTNKTPKVLTLAAYCILQFCSKQLLYGFRVWMA